MKSTGSKLSDTDGLLAKLVDGHNLSASEAKKLFTNIFIYDEEGYHLAVLVSAIHAKGETSDELLGFCESTQALAAKLEPQVSKEKLIDLSGTGGASFKTINVSTLASYFGRDSTGPSLSKAISIVVLEKAVSAGVYSAASKWWEHLGRRVL